MYFCVLIFERKIFEQEDVFKVEQAKQGSRVSMVCDWLCQRLGLSENDQRFLFQDG